MTEHPEASYMLALEVARDDGATGVQGTTASEAQAPRVEDTRADPE